MRKITLSLAALMLSTTIASADINLKKENCGELDRLARAAFGTAFFGLPLGPAGVVIGLAAGSIAHDYECELNEFSKSQLTDELVKNLSNDVEIKDNKIVFEQFALFDKDSIVLNNMVDDILRLDNDVIKSVTIIGHASAPGTEVYNEEIGLKRAIVVAEKIKSFVDESKVAVSTKGETELYSEDDYLNQRVQVIVEYK